MSMARIRLAKVRNTRLDIDALPFAARGMGALAHLPVQRA
jgi:hypothetical protein